MSESSTDRRNVATKGSQSWSFNPPARSHFVGVWECVIRMVRRILNAVLRQQRLDDDGRHTVMCEAEAILNDRPITKLSDDPNDLEPLTPNHILLMKGKPSVPPGLFEQHDLYVRRRWRQVQYISDLFWKRWIREYLPLLQERQKWNQRREHLKPGDIVIIMDPTAPRGSWPLGRVLEAFHDNRGLARSVCLQTKTSIIEWPVTKLCLMYELRLALTCHHFILLMFQTCGVSIGVISLCPLSLWLPLVCVRIVMSWPSQLGAGE